MLPSNNTSAHVHSSFLLYSPVRSLRPKRPSLPEALNTDQKGWGGRVGRGGMGVIGLGGRGGVLIYISTLSPFIIQF